MTLPDLLASGRRFPGVLTRLRNFQARGAERAHAKADDAGSGEDASDTEDEYAGMIHGVRPEWTVVDRIIARRRAAGKRGGGGDAASGAVEYLVKWKELGYEDCTWESESSLEEYAAEVQRFTERGPIDAGDAGATRTAAAGRGKQRARAEAAADAGPSAPFVRLTATPPYLAGGSLHPYQLEGVNWLLNAHAAKNHVILADEMASAPRVRGARSHLLQHLTQRSLCVLPSRV